MVGSINSNIIYYHPLRQSAPYFDNVGGNSTDEIPDAAPRKSSISDSSMGGSRIGQHVRWNLNDSTSVTGGTPIRRGSSIQSRLNVMGDRNSAHQNPLFLYNNNQSSSLMQNNNTNEADAAGGGFFPRRVSSFNLLYRSGSTETIGKATTSSGSVGGSSSNANATFDLNTLTSPSIVAEHRRKLYHKHRIHAMDMTSSTMMSSPIKPDWRLRDRMKTVGVGLIMSLNVGTDPPDIIKPNPCAVLQCWIDPRPTIGSGSGIITTNLATNTGTTTGMTRAKARELIGERLERQYSKWQLTRTARPLKFRKALDPTVEDVRNMCIRLRREARNERILLHFNGHGVPKPTNHGEIWVFDKNHTEYIPLSVSDLRLWMGKPNIVVLDCSSAGTLVPFFLQSLNGSEQNMTSQQPDIRNNNNDNANGNKNENTNDEGEDENEQDDFAWVHDTILLCPCSENEWLPMHPNYPADIFTSCLTTPIPIALRWFIRQNQYLMNMIHPDSVDRIPGQANDRKTPLGELNWIFTCKFFNSICISFMFFFARLLMLSFKNFCDILTSSVKKKIVVSLFLLW
jgi:Raptor N-terminal CASPase like domain